MVNGMSIPHYNHFYFLWLIISNSNRITHLKSFSIVANMGHTLENLLISLLLIKQTKKNLQLFLIPLSRIIVIQVIKLIQTTWFWGVNLTAIKSSNGKYSNFSSNDMLVFHFILNPLLITLILFELTIKNSIIRKWKTKINKTTNPQWELQQTFPHTKRTPQAIF